MDKEVKYQNDKWWGGRHWGDSRSDASAVTRLYETENKLKEIISDDWPRNYVDFTLEEESKEYRRVLIEICWEIAECYNYAPDVAKFSSLNRSQAIAVGFFAGLACVNTADKDALYSDKFKGFFQDIWRFVV